MPPRPSPSSLGLVREWVFFPPLVIVSRKRVWRCWRATVFCFFRAAPFICCLLLSRRLIPLSLPPSQQQTLLLSEAPHLSQPSMLHLMNIPPFDASRRRRQHNGWGERLRWDERLLFFRQLSSILFFFTSAAETPPGLLPPSHRFDRLCATYRRPGVHCRHTLQDWKVVCWGGNDGRIGAL